MKLVILDRDGVINQDSDDYIKTPAEWEPIPGSLEAIARLSNAGMTVAVATNQSGLARGLLDIETLSAIHQTLRARLASVGGRIEVIAFCPHGPLDGCACRKPEIGLLNEISRRTAAPLDLVPVIGDSLKDLQCAVRAGARPILVRTGKGEAAAAALPAELAEICIVDDLAAAADVILQR